MKNVHMTRFILLFSLLTVGTVAAFAALPQTINYQGYLKDAASGVPASGPVDITFRLYSSNSGANPLWTGQQSVTPQNGIYSTPIGPISLPFDRQYWLGVTVGNDPELKPLQQLDSVPYALRAASADSSATADTLSEAALTQLDSRYVDPLQPQRPTNQQIATQRWDQVQGVLSGNFIPVGTAPTALMFDGTYIWVALAGDGITSGTVQRVNPATSVLTGNPIPVGVNPAALVFDGTYIWVANQGNQGDGDSVTRITASTATVSGTFLTGGNGPAALAWDGTLVWVANSTSNNLTRINPATGATVASPISVGANANPVALVYDGTNIWSANKGTNSITKITAESAIKVGTYPVGSAPAALTYNGLSLWVANSGDNSIWEVYPIDPSLTSSYQAPGTPAALINDGTYLWTATSQLHKLSYGTSIGSFNTNGIPGALAFDGANIWVAYRNNGSIVKLANAGKRLGVATIDSQQLQDYSVITTRIADSAVTTTKIADNSVTSAKIVESAVTNTKIADSNVTDSKIAGPLSDSKLSANVALLDSAQTFTGAKTFSAAPSFSASSEAPFSVTSQTAVTNLNADQLDGKHADSFANAYQPSLANFGVGPITHYSDAYFVLEALDANTLRLRNVSSSSFQNFGMIYPTNCVAGSPGSATTSQVFRYSFNSGDTLLATFCADGSMIQVNAAVPNTQYRRFTCWKYAGNANYCWRMD